ncbi:MAG: hypothetical protein PUC30_10830 [Lachnospiraceae bacterium]|nr:hypothetical protein [Lachnospiraceae bacterium]
MIITVNSVLPDDKGNQYKVISIIKSGGFGQFFLCERFQDNKDVSIRTLHFALPV